MSTVAPAPTIVAGPANDPYVPQAGGLRSSLRFFCDLPPQARVLDVGCGQGEHLAELVRGGCQVTGVEIDPRAAESLRAQGYDVRVGIAESLPLLDSSFDAVVCSVVIPYTDERRAIAEWSRVLVPGGQVRASYHGAAFPLKYLLHGPGIRRRLYGGRTLLNSWVYRVTSRRLPGFWGDTLYQSAARLKKYYRQSGFQLLAEYVRPALGLRDVFFHHLQKLA